MKVLLGTLWCIATLILAIWLQGRFHDYSLTITMCWLAGLSGFVTIRPNMASILGEADLLKRYAAAKRKRVEISNLCQVGKKGNPEVWTFPPDKVGSEVLGTYWKLRLRVEDVQTFDMQVYHEAIKALTRNIFPAIFVAVLWFLSQQPIGANSVALEIIKGLAATVPPFLQLAAALLLFLYVRRMAFLPTT